MPDRSYRPSTAQNAAEPADPYLGRLKPEDAETYQAMTDHPDLGREIRLMRTILASLSGDIPVNRGTLGTILNALVRAIAFQIGQSGDGDEMAQALKAASERFLREKEAAAAERRRDAGEK